MPELARRSWSPVRIVRHFRTDARRGSTRHGRSCRYTLLLPAHTSHTHTHIFSVAASHVCTPTTRHFSTISINQPLQIISRHALVIILFAVYELNGGKVDFSLFSRKTHTKLRLRRRNARREMILIKCHINLCNVHATCANWCFCQSSLIKRSCKLKNEKEDRTSNFIYFGNLIHQNW